MCSSMASFSLCLTPKTPFSLHPSFNFTVSGNAIYHRIRSPSRYSLSHSIAQRDSSFQLSGSSWDAVTSGDYNGWAIAEEDYPKPVKKKGLHMFAVIGIGASVVGVIGLLAYFSSSSKGFGLQVRSSLNAFHVFSLPSLLSDKDSNKAEETSSDVSLEDAQVPAESLEDVSEASVATVQEASFDNMQAQKLDQKLERIIVPFSVDSAQQEAFAALKKLKIIEDDANANELCTRREYARWLVRANSQLERSRKHHINSSAALSGSRVAAFDDVGVDDPDFEYIQSLAEVGIVKSKLSNGDSSSNPIDVEEPVDFNPDRFISRQDLVRWRAKIEYELVREPNEKISRKNIGFLDVKEIASDALTELYADIQSDEKSIIRAVFGQSKRLQPSKPCTKAQAAVALASGRMAEFMQAEISRLEAENIARQNELQEVRSEILERGQIQEYWDRKMEEERSRGLKVEMECRTAMNALEEEKAIQENAVAEFVREKAALGCQEQLLSSLRDEVTDMSERFSTEKAKYIEEQRDLKGAQHDLHVNYEKLLDTKSILEAEVEALRILKSWIKEEARKSQARAKILEEAGRRWKWNS